MLLKDTFHRLTKLYKLYLNKSIKQKFESTIVTSKDNTAYIKHHVQSIVNIIIKQYYINITLIIINSIGAMDRSTFCHSSLEKYTFVQFEMDTLQLYHHFFSIVNIIIKQYYINITLIIINSIG